MPSPTPMYFTGTWPHADVLHRHLELLGDGDDDAPLGGAVQLGEHDAGDAGGLLELLGLDQAVLAGGGVQHQQGLPVAAGQLPVHHPGDLVQLVHQVLLVVQPPGGVDEHHVGVPGPGGGEGVKHHGGGVGPLVLAHQLHAGALAPDLQLVGGGGPEGVPGGHQHPPAIPLEGGGQLADGGGLAHAGHPDEQGHRRRGGQAEGGVAHLEHLGEHPPQAGPSGVHVLDLLRLHPLPQLLHRLQGGVHPHVPQDQGLLQLVVKVVVQLPGEQLVKGVADVLLGAGQPRLDLFKKAHVVPVPFVVQT